MNADFVKRARELANWIKERDNFAVIYNYDADGQLESTVIAPDGMADELTQYEGVTPKLNVYAYANGQITPATITEMKARNESSGVEAVPGEAGDHAMTGVGRRKTTSDFGGIDFKPDKVDSAFAVKMDSRLRGNDKEGIKFHIDPAMLKQLQNAPGFMPVIINIQPMDDLRLFLGLGSSQNTVASSVGS